MKKESEIPPAAQDALADERRRNIQEMAKDESLKAQSLAWLIASARRRYSYNFLWLGRPVIQYPQDLLALQEIIWSARPDLIVETGVAHGGSLVFSASMLELLGGAKRRVVGIDVEIRPHNREAIEAHPLARRIRLVEGSSTSPAVVDKIHAMARDHRHPLVILDSNHTHAHVLTELELYSPLVRKGSYVVVFDTVVEDLPPDTLWGRPWGPGNSPRTAVREFLRNNRRFTVDQEIENRLLITVAPGGYLRCIED